MWWAWLVLLAPLGLVLMALATATLLLCLRWRLAADLQAGATPAGLWSARAHARLGPVPVVGRLQLARGAARPELSVQVLGRRIVDGWPAPKPEREKPEKDGPFTLLGRSPRPAQLIDLATALVGRLGAERFQLDLSYGFDDAFASGQIYAWLCAARGILAPLGEIRTHVDWTGDAPIDCQLQARVSVVPVQLLGVAWRSFRRWPRAPRPRPSKAPPAPAKVARARGRTEPCPTPTPTPSTSWSRSSSKVSAPSPARRR
jgi:hypothetical protein